MSFDRDEGEINYINDDSFSRTIKNSTRNDSADMDALLWSYQRGYDRGDFREESDSMLELMQFMSK